MGDPTSPSGPRCPPASLSTASLTGLHFEGAGHGTVTPARHLSVQRCRDRLLWTPQTRWAPSRTFPPATSALMPRDSRARSGPYLEPWERRCPGPPRTWTHVTGRSGVRLRQRAASNGHSCPGHRCGACRGRAGGQGGRWRGPGGRRVATVCPGGSLLASAAAAARDRQDGSLRAARARPQPSPGRGARALAGRSAPEPGGERAPAALRAPSSGAAGRGPGSCPWC